MPLSGRDKLGPYEIIESIGVGGMGEVYRARDPRLDRDVAIKVSRTEFNDRFGREAKAIAALNHPHICQIYDVGPNYLVMEYIEGESLKGPLPLEKASEYASQIASALEAAHTKKITHRDLKPANILVTASGVKLLDFGLAKIELGDTGAATQSLDLTEAGAIIGTVTYMSPEQTRGEEVDARSDIFSFGLVLYEMLSGSKAFAKKSAIETMAAIIRDEPEPLDAPSSVLAIIARCIRKLPADRFQTMREVRAAIEQAFIKPAENVLSMASIAVLPFVNMSRDAGDEYFSDGLAEEIINALTQVKGLKVIARTSAFAFKGKNEDIRQIAGMLGVGNVLEGSVRRAESRLRITAQLIHAADGTHLWSQRYDRDMTDVFAIQDEISRAISEALQVRLAPRAKTMNIEAYQNYLKGQYYRARLTPGSMAKAKEFYELALAVDPNYAPAYSGLAAYFSIVGLLGTKPVSDVAPLARAAAEKALALDPANSDAHSVLGIMAAAFDYDWKLGEAHFRQAMAADPVPLLARVRYVLWYLLPLGRSADALEQCRLALQTDPLSMILHQGMAFSMYRAKQLRETIEYVRRALEIDANFHLLWLTMGLAQLHAGLTGEAIASFKRGAELAPWDSLIGWQLAAAYHQAGDGERGRELAAQLAGSNSRPIGAASYYAAIGEVDAMFEALDTAYQQRDPRLIETHNDPLYDRYRGDPRFQALLLRMNLAPAKHAPPPETRIAPQPRS